MIDSGLVVDQQSTLLGDYCSTAVFSPDRVYRYVLTRTWDPGTPRVVFVMLNPSTADAFTLDPTVRRCVGFARTWGAGGLVVLNLFAYRASDPRVLNEHASPVGPVNDVLIRRYLLGGGPVVAAWGAHPMVRRHGRDSTLRAVAAETTARGLGCLGVTAAGAPRHPLYVRADQPLTAWTG